MPNLEQTVVTAWLTELQPRDAPAWPPAIRPLEATGRAPERLVSFGAALDGLVPADLPRLRDALRNGPLLPGLRALMAQLGAARTLRLLHWLAEVDLPECHDVITALTDGNEPEAQALRATISVITRAAIVRRMFAPERIAALEHACMTIKENCE
jgi:hypothetical protein